MDWTAVGARHAAPAGDACVGPYVPVKPSLREREVYRLASGVLGEASKNASALLDISSGVGEVICPYPSPIVAGVGKGGSGPRDGSPGGVGAIR